MLNTLFEDAERKVLIAFTCLYSKFENKNDKW